MKRRVIAFTFMSVFMASFAFELNAQKKDSFFTPYTSEKREGVSEEGLSFNNFYGGIEEGFGQQEGLTFGGFTGKDLSDTQVPVGNGMFIMATTSMLYLITKRRKENK